MFGPYVPFSLVMSYWEDDITSYDEWSGSSPCNYSGYSVLLTAIVFFLNLWLSVAGWQYGRVSRFCTDPLFVLRLLSSRLLHVSCDAVCAKNAELWGRCNFTRRVCSKYCNNTRLLGLVPLSVWSFFISWGCRCLKANRYVYVSLEGTNVESMFFVSRSLL